MNKQAVYLSLGSNIGNRLSYIHTALEMLRQYMTVDQCSFLYETEPIGFVEQDKFLNIVCKCHTPLTPMELLEFLEQVMTDMGRMRTQKWGPRIIDIDILLYDDIIFNNDRLIIPHPRMYEREFVMKPLADINPDLARKVTGDTSRVQKVTQIGNQLFAWGTKTFVVGIVNATPDSFSGDGLMSKTDSEQLEHINQLVIGGAAILDIGAMSSKPGHQLVSEKEELERLIPIIKQVKQNMDIPISIDTFRSNVARAAIDAGADMINSIWGAEYDPELLRVVQEKNIPIVLTQNRMVTHYFQTDKLLQDMIDEALRAGIYPWNIIVDPGIGFVQHTEDNYEVIKNIPGIVAYGYPVLVGVSRKKFIRQIVDTTDNNALVVPNVVAHVAMARAGASIVRVHDVAAVVDGLRISDTLGI
jgi:dihydropteroate synthase/2-amino-4-hydroxy-6-hydroxymethyldihydropteridine diphosphokinase